MFLIGYISSFSIAIVLSMFYMGYAIQHISDIFKEEKKEIRLTEFSSFSASKEIATFYFVDCLATETNEEKVNIFENIEDISYIPLLEEIPKEEQNYSLFSRPPPFVA